MKTTKIKPTSCTATDAEGNPLPRRVRKPGGGVLAAGGEVVPMSTYWKRRLARGEVEQVKGPGKKTAEV